MKEYLNSDIFFSSLMLLMSEPSSCCLVLEGDDDLLALKPHINDEDIIALAAVGGKPGALRAAELALRHGYTRVRFVVDQDHDGYFQSIQLLGNVYTSRSHDFFMDLILADPAVVERALEVRMRKVYRRPNDAEYDMILPPVSQIFKEAMALASPVSMVRIASTATVSGIRFEGFPFHRLSGGGVKDVVDILDTWGRIPSGRKIDLLEEAEDVAIDISKEDVSFVGDHDFFSALSAVLNKFKVKCAPEDLRGEFMLAVTCGQVKSLSWFDTFHRWCQGQGKAGFTCAVLDLR